MASTDERVWRSPDARPLGVASLEFAQIISIMRQRRTMDAKLIRAMVTVRDRYNGEVVVPMPDVKNAPAMTPPAPNLVIEAIENNAMRANGVPYRITAPPLDPRSETSRARADLRRRTLYGRAFESQLELKLGRSFRHLTGYGTHAMMVMPDDRLGHSVIEIRDPLSAYPELRAPDDIREPKNVGFIFGRSVDWIRQHYPHTSGEFIRQAAGRNWDTLWDVVEWIDENEVVIGIMGPKIPAYGAMDARPYGYTAYELARWQNKAGCCPVVCGRRITLDQIMGQVTAMLGFNDMFARGMALDWVAMERSIFPDLVIIGANGAKPQIFSGEWKDGRTGQANVISNASVQVLERGPGPMSAQVLASAEDAIRSTAGANGPDSMKGSARTGAAISQYNAFAVDPRMQESQNIMARSLAEIFRFVMEVEKGYYPKQKFTVIPGLRSDMETVEYIPERDFDLTKVVVDYPFAGLDVAQLSVALTQLEETNIISKATVRSAHPFVDDGGQEGALINVEQLDEALLQGYAAQLQSASIDVAEGAHVRKLVGDGMDLFEAILQSRALAATGQPPAGTPGASQPGQPALPPGAGQPPGLPAGGQSAMSPADQQLLQAINKAGGPESGPPNASVPPPPAALVNGQHLERAINTNLSATAV